MDQFLFSWIILEEERCASSSQLFLSIRKEQSWAVALKCVVHCCDMKGWWDSEHVVGGREASCEEELSWAWMKAKEEGKKEGKKMVSQQRQAVHSKDIGKMWMRGSWLSGKWVSLTLSTSLLFSTHAFYIGDWRTWLLILTRMCEFLILEYKTEYLCEGPKGNPLPIRILKEGGGYRRVRIYYSLKGTKNSKPCSRDLFWVSWPVLHAHLSEQIPLSGSPLLSSLTVCPKIQTEMVCLSVEGHLTTIWTLLLSPPSSLPLPLPPSFLIFFPPSLTLSFPPSHSLSFLPSFLISSFCLFLISCILHSLFLFFPLGFLFNYAMLSIKFARGAFCHWATPQGPFYFCFRLSQTDLELAIFPLQLPSICMAVSSSAWIEWTLALLPHSTVPFHHIVSPPPFSSIQRYFTHSETETKIIIF